MAGKQPLKKKEVKTADDKMAALRAFKASNNLDTTRQKETQWLCLGDAWSDITRTPGIPLNTVVSVRGASNTGKSTLKLEIIKAAQRQGIVPVVFELENSFSWTHAKDIGVKINEYVNEETGEVEYGPSDDMIFYDTKKLYEIYGLYDHANAKWLTKPNRETYVIEDVAMCIRELIRKQRSGELPVDMIFIIDSIGVGDCYKSAVASSSNNMWYANAVSTAFNVIVNDLIPSCNNVDSEYSNTLFFINKIWKDSMTSPTGIPIARSKGGDSLFYSVRYGVFLGGVASAGVKALTATSGGKEYKYGIKTKINIEKNHINNLTYNGEICSLQQGFWNPDKLDEYKKTYASFIKAKLAEKYDISSDEIGNLDFDEKEESDD